MNWDLQLHIYGAFAIVWYISKETFFYNALRCLPNVPPLLTMSFFFLLFFWCGIRASFLWIYSIMSSLDRICMPYFLGFKNPPRCNCFPPMMRLVKDGYLLIQTRRKSTSQLPGSSFQLQPTPWKLPLYCSTGPDLLLLPDTMVLGHKENWVRMSQHSQVIIAVMSTMRFSVFVHVFESEVEYHFHYTQ